MNTDLRLPDASYPELYEQCITAFGQDFEIDIAIEEMSELTKALVKHRRIAAISADKKEIAKAEQNVHEEMADVIIMLSQLLMIFGGQEQISEYIDSKIKRLECRLNNAALKNISVADLGLSDRVYLALSRANIRTLYDLSKRDLTKVRHIGTKSINEINECLAKFTKGDA